MNKIHRCISRYVSRYVKTFRFHSTFFKTFLAVLLLSSFLLGGLCLYLLHRENSNLQEKAESSYINLLETACTAMELTLQNMQQLMQQTIWRGDFTNALLIPTADNYTRTRNIIDQLNRLADGNPFIGKAYLYVPSNRTIYSSDRLYFPVAENQDRLPFEPDSLFSYNGSRLSPDPDAMFIKEEDGQIFLCQHLYPDNIESIGMLIFSFDLSKLTLYPGQTDQGLSDPLCVFDREGNAVFSQSVPAGAAERASLLLNRKTELAKGNLHSAEDSGYFYYQSPETDWLYLYPSKTEPASLYAAARMIVPFLLSAVGVTLFFSLNVAYRANRPIRNLLNKLGRPGSDIGGVQNEIDYLAQVYDDTAARNRHLQEAIQEVTPLVLERLFSDILNGRAPTEEDIEAALGSLSHPFLPDTGFLVITLELSGKNKETVSVLEMNLLLLRIRESLLQVLPAGFSSYLAAGGGQAASVILAVIPGEEDETVRQAVRSVNRGLRDMMKGTVYQIEIGCGNIYRRITDVRYSYLEAQKNLNRRRFYGETGSGEEENLPGQNRFFEITNQILACIQSGDTATALAFADRAIDGIDEEAAAAPPEEHLWSGYNLFLQSMIECTDTLHIGSVEELLRKKERLSASLNRETDREKIKAAVRCFCANVIGSIEHKNKKKAFQHVIRIKEYIHANYSDSSLSLDTAAEQIGISPSYLSRLFKQEMGTSFVDYVSGYRVEKSKNLLSATDLLIKDIAYQTGFNSMQNFFRIFKKLTGLSPGEYRSEIGKE